MSAPILSKKERKKSLSGIKNRKKVRKTVLAAPAAVQIRKPEVDASQISKILDTLNSLLRCARLPKDRELQKDDTSRKNKNTPLTEASLKRKQLLLGINSVSRAVSNGSIASVIFADDIVPQLLINHLRALCTLKKIPYIYMENFRNLTKSTLGFPCIVLGIKKDSNFFAPVTTLITSAVTIQSDHLTMETSVQNDETPADIVIEEKRRTCEKMESTFTYLYRDSNKKRIFSPVSDSLNLEKDNSESFISLESGDEGKGSVPIKYRKKIPTGKIFGLDKSVIIGKKEKQRINKEEHDLHVEYSATEIIKMGANPDREKKKYKKLKAAKKL